MRVLGLLAVLLCGSSCEAPKCAPSNCDGCCAADNRCQLGTAATSCGASGNVCAVCTPVQQCQLGSCTGNAGGGAGGGTGGTGGGGGAGGGGGGVDAGLSLTPQLRVDRSTVGFGTEFGSGTWVGTSPQQSLLMRNQGMQSLIVSAVTLTGTGFSLLAPDAGATLASGEQGFVRVLYTPTAAGPQMGLLTITSNDPNSPSTAVQLRGLGVASTGGVGSNPECRAADCFSAADRGADAGFSGWLDYTEDGQTLAYQEDADGDGRGDWLDNCPFTSNRDQLDGDGDGVGDSCDNCAAASNTSQLDQDADGQGDLCDGDLDGDTLLNASDNCPAYPNRDQLDTNSNNLGNACENDDDGDGIADPIDVCPLLPNPGNQPVSDPRCNADADGDNISDAFDNCAAVGNATQADRDLDGLGDLCDQDQDNDGVPNQADNCALFANRAQRDEDGDGIGDGCDPLFCVVVDFAASADCLNPSGPFKVHAGGAVTLGVNELFRLPLFANRNGAALRYSWTVTARPAGSTATITNATGLAGLSRAWQYAYIDGRVPLFRPDRAGDYSLQVQATLGAADRAYPDNNAATAALRLTVAP